MHQSAADTCVMVLFEEAVPACMHNSLSLCVCVRVSVHVSLRACVCVCVILCVCTFMQSH